LQTAGGKIYPHNETIGEMRAALRFTLLLVAMLMSGQLQASDSVYYELWEISSLETIGGHAVQVFGDPQVVNTEMGDAVQFDGVDDRLLVDFNPVMDAKEFTVELVFKPDACYPENTAPRFVHIQDPDDPDGKRVMIELRVDANNQCYMDGFIKTDSESLALIDENLVHATHVWQHVAITYKDSTFTTYFNGEKELSGTLRYAEAIVNPTGQTSLGGRMNHVAFYAGLMKTLKVSHASLEPGEFIVPEQTDSSTSNAPVNLEESSLEIFPVPADEFLSVNLVSEQLSADTEIQIFDVSGKLCHSEENLKHKKNLQLNTSGFRDGVYLLRIISNGLSRFHRFVVVHSP
jgi:hypothetical protein